MTRLRLVLSALVLVWGAPASRAAAAPLPPLVPADHADFDTYNLALTWQPGFCGTGSGCLPDQPKAQRIGLHGLWASLPESLSSRGITNPQWWAKGCDLLHHSDAQPDLPPALRAELAAVIPQISTDLLHHEYDKHVQCFRFDTATYFRTELRMRDAVLRTAFAATLIAATGTAVDHGSLLAAFADSFHDAAPRALQLQCQKDARGETLLTQLWITLRRTGIGRFPAASSLTDSPVPQDNCPARFLVPSW